MHISDDGEDETSGNDNGDSVGKTIDEQRHRIEVIQSTGIMQARQDSQCS